MKNNAAHGSKKTLRIASYNIRKAVGLDRRRNPGRILDVVNSIEADLVVLQEADRRLGKRPAAIPGDMIEIQTDLRLLPVAQNCVSIGWHGNAVLLRKGVHHGPIHLLDLPGLEPRGAVIVEIQAHASLWLAAVHLGLTRNFRRRQLQTICKSLPGSGNTIIAGDFNEWSMDKGLEPLAEKFDVFSPGKSFHSAFPVAALDRMATSQGITVTDAGVEQGSLARQASDHLPVWMDVTFDDPANWQAKGMAKTTA